MYFLFMQLFLIHDYKYNLLFTGIYAVTLAIQNHTLLPQILSSTAISFFPIGICLDLNYDSLLWIPFFLYSIAVNITILRDKKLSIEHDYINALFEDFNKYIKNLNTEYNKNIKIKEMKEKKLEEISSTYCANCSKTTLCKTKKDKRYCFLSAAMLGLSQNIYGCPYYSRFKLDMNVENVNKSFEYSAIKSLAFELSYLYNQSLALKKDYEKFISLLYNHDYLVTDLDINLASSSLYFSICLDKRKPIIESILLKCSYKAFGEVLDMKIVEDKIYFFKKPMLKITYAHTVLAKEGNLISGDNYYI